MIVPAVRTGTRLKTPVRQQNRIVFGNQPQLVPQGRLSERAHPIVAILAALSGLYYAGTSNYDLFYNTLPTLQAARTAWETQVREALKPVQEHYNALNNKIAGLRLSPDMVSSIQNTHVGVFGQTERPGSGTWIRDKQGRLFIITNDHVVRDNAIEDGQNPPHFNIRVFNGNDFQTPITLKAQVYKYKGRSAQSPSYDLAVLAVMEPAQIPSSIQAAHFRDMGKDPVQVGDTVVVVGAPYRLNDNVAAGTVSKVDVRIGPQYETGQGSNYYLINAPIADGNSGGGLFDDAGRYIGMNTRYLMEDGLGFSATATGIQALLKNWGIELEERSS